MNSERSPGLAREQAKLIITLGLDHGLSLSECLKGSKIKEYNILSLNNDISVEQELQLIQNLTEQVNECPFQMGFQIGLEGDFNSLGIIGHALLSSSTTLEAINVMSRYLSTTYHFIKFRLNLTNQHAKLSFDLQIDCHSQVSQFIVARDMGIFIAVHKTIMSGNKSNASEVGFIFDYLPGMSAIESYFNCPVICKQTENYIIGDINNLNLPMPYKNSVTAKILEESCYQNTGKQPENIQVSLLRDNIWLMLNAAEHLELDLADIAKNLNMSPRTLGRQLLSEFRAYKSRTLLAESDQSLQQISDQLGYSNKTAFINAFTRSNRVSPKQVSPSI